MKWSRIILIIQAVLIALLFTALLIYESEENKSFEISVEICEKAKIQRIIWNASIKVQHTDLNIAHEQLDSDKERVTRYFVAKGLSKDEISFLKVRVENLANGTYKLVQEMRIVSSQILQVQKIVSESSDLLRFNVNFSGEEPRYELANFEVWLNRCIPRLLQSAKEILRSENPVSEDEPLMLQKLSIEPIHANKFNICISDPMENSDRITVRLRAKLVLTSE